MPSDTLKYWLAVSAIMLVMWGYSGKVSTAIMFGVAAVGAFIYWQVSAARRKREADAHEGRPRGA
ncbi:hypothetical protein [Pseudorhodoplanes sp.]|uniref:hypothetical protein n=1 Tax=Pseudorhodoplanes sp. TaxID=1934341 RepID=UPI002C436F15|nr:hypothetical protein [Pseudorhodoplanes sp.]HWV53475.1 hypothetical protein [Pseudorhodoplanes sp.]